MASLDWARCSAVESIPGKVSGAWVFKGTRTPVAVVFVNPDPSWLPANGNPLALQSWWRI